jgi:dTMP kinase
MHLETETLLMFAARREHLACLIEPALARGEWVICDRFSDATYAYQGGGRGLDRAKFLALEHWVHEHLQPDLTLLFDLPLDVARERIAVASRVLDRFEQERADFHERVRQAYLERAHMNPSRIRVVDANNTLDSIRKTLEQIVITSCL